MNWKTRLLGVLFLLFPVALSFLGNRLLFDDSRQVTRENTEERLETILGEVESRRDYFEHFSRTFRALENRVFRSANPVETWKTVRKELELRYPGMLETLMLDGSGHPIEGLCERPVSRNLVQKFFLAYRRFLEDGQPIPSLEQSFVRSYLGRMVSADFVIHHRFQMATGDPDRSYLYLSAPTAKGMLILFFKTPRQPIFLALRDIIAQINRRSTKRRLALLVNEENPDTLLKSIPGSSEVPDGYWNELSRTSTGGKWFGETLVVRRILFPSIWVVGVASQETSETHAGPWPRLISGTFLLACGFLLLLRALEPWFLASVRFKLLAAFLYSSFMPLIIMGATANSYFHEHRRILEGNTHDQVEKAFIGFDRSFRDRLRAVSWELNQRYFSLPNGETASLTHLISNIQEIHQKYLFDSCLVFNTQGQVVFNFRAPGQPPVAGKLLESVGKMAKTAMESSNAGRNPGKEHGRGSSMEEKTLQGRLSAKPMLDQLDFGPVRFFFAVYPLGRPPDVLTHIAIWFWIPDRMEHQFLSNHLARLNGLLAGGQVLAWSHQNPGVFLPKDFPQLASLRPILSRINNRYRSFRTRLSILGQTYLLTGLRLTTLSGYSILRLTPDIAINEEMTSLSWRFRFITLLLVCFGGLVGSALAQYFLLPIQGLRQGLESLQRNDFRLQIPVYRADELGIAARLLNEAAGELQDLELARTLQETFFPRDPLQAGLWSMFGQCRPASQVGGDYFDYFSLDGNRACLLVGDVAGHGVGAALVVAMARVALNHPACRGDAEKMLQYLDELLSRVLKRRKMMSCCLGVLDTETQNLLLINAGHPWPLLSQPGSADYIQTKGLPLGCSRKWQAVRFDLALQENEAILFYSDGLVEAQDALGQPVGYSRLQQSFPGLRRETARDTIEAVNDWFMRLAPLSPPADDVTMLVLQKSSSSGKEKRA